MPIIEYEAGAPFPASSAARPTSRPRRGRPPARDAGGAERPVRRARRHRLRAARLLRQPDRDAELRRAGRGRPALHEHAHHRAVLAEPLLPPHRPQPPQQRHGLHHRARRRASPATTASSRSRTASSPRCCVEHGYNTFMVGKWHLTPSRPGDRRRARTTAGRSARGFERFYGFLGGDTSQWYPDLVYDNHQVEPPRTPEEGYHLTEDLADKAISSSPTPSRSTPDKPFFLHLCFGATHAPHHVPKEWVDRYAGAFDDGWDAYREQVFAPPEGARASSRPDAELSRHDPDVPDWDALPADERRLYSRMMEVLRRLPQPHRPPPRPAARLPREHGRARQHARHGDLRQRRQRRGRPDRHDQRGAVLQQRARSRSRTAWRRIDEIGGPSTSTTTRGAGPGPATRRSGAGSGRPTAAASPTRSSSHWPQGIAAKGEVRDAVRPRHRHGADRPRRARHRAAGDDPRRDPVAAPGRQLRAHLRRRRRAAERAPHAVLRDARPPRRSTTTAGGRSARGPAPRSPRPASGSASRSRPRRSPSSTPTGWELYHVAEDFAENHNVAAEQPRQADRADRHLVRRGRQVRRPADRRQRAAADGRPRSRRSPRPREQLRLPARTRSRCRSSPARGCSTGRTASPRDGRDPRGRRRGRAALPGHGGRRLLALRQGRRLHYVHNYVGARACTGCRLRSRVPAGRARAPLRVRADRRAGPAERARARPGRLQLYVDGEARRPTARRR